MANKKSQKNTIIGSIITVIILIILTITGNDSQIFKSTTSATNDNVSSEVLDNLENVSIQTGNDCISTIPQDNNLRVYCLDVGQGDSILITNNNKTMLIDASTNEMGSRVVKYSNDLGIKKIDYLVGTHPHEDHIGGLDNVTGGQNASFNPKGEKAAKIAAKIMAGRAKAAKSKGEKMSGNSGVLMRYVSILTVGV